mmetsp:Transcript_36321/g.73995  ORF Transcript_36321/g.73995 Transcript_36321/m.73995 type:complete len:249 (-) Transcript_36321:1540-2286(-)
MKLHCIIDCLFTNSILDIGPVTEEDTTRILGNKAIIIFLLFGNEVHCTLIQTKASLQLDPNIILPLQLVPFGFVSLKVLDAIYKYHKGGWGTDIHFLEFPHYATWILANSIMDTLEVVNNSETMCNGDARMTQLNGCNLDECLPTAVLMRGIVRPNNDMLQLNTQFPQPCSEYSDNFVKTSIVHLMIILFTFLKCLSKEVEDVDITDCNLFLVLDFLSTFVLLLTLRVYDTFVPKDDEVGDYSVSIDG